MMRPLTNSDRDQAVNLISQFFEHHSRCVTAPRVFSREECHSIWGEWLSDGLLFGLEEDGQVLGLLRFRHDRGTYWIENLVVDEPWRGTGMGRRMLDWAEKWAQSNGARSLFLDVVPANLEALDFFLEHGYEYLNTIELRKNFYETPAKAETELLGRRLKIHSWPAGRQLP